MGLLDYADAARNKLAGLLGSMPISQIAQGSAQVTQNGLLGALRGMPVFDPAQGAQDAYSAGLGGLGTIKTHGPSGLPINPDGTVTLYHGTTKNGAERIKETGMLKSAGEPSVYLTTDKTGAGYGDGTVVAVDVPANKIRLDDEFPSGRKDFAINVGKPGGSIPVVVR